MQGVFYHTNITLSYWHISQLISFESSKDDVFTETAANCQLPRSSFHRWAWFDQTIICDEIRFRPTNRLEITSLWPTRWSWPSFVIKLVDKGSGVVVMDKTIFIKKCNRQLNSTSFYTKQKITSEICDRESNQPFTTYKRQYLNKR